MTIGKLFSDVLKSNTFANLSQGYTRYLTMTCSVGLVLGMFGAGAYELDRIKANNIAKQRLMKEHDVLEDFELTDEELATCSDSNLHFFTVRVFGPLFGLTLGFIYPVVVITSPIYFVFCRRGRSFINSCLTTLEETMNTKKEENDVIEHINIYH